MTLYIWPIYLMCNIPYSLYFGPDSAFLYCQYLTGVLKLQVWWSLNTHDSRKHYCQAFWWLTTGIFHIHIAKNSHDSSQPMKQWSVTPTWIYQTPQRLTQSVLLSLQPWWKNSIAWTPDGRSCWRLASLGSAWLRFVLQQMSLRWSMRTLLSMC